MPTRLLALYEEAMTDPDLLNLNDEISIITARINDLLERFESGESGMLWRKLRAAAKELVTARNTGDADGLAYWLNELLTLIDKGATEAARFAEIEHLLQQRRKLVDSERKRRVEMQNFITPDQVMLLAQALGRLVAQHVPDGEPRRSIIAGMQQLLSDRKYATA